MNPTPTQPGVPADSLPNDRPRLVHAACLLLLLVTAARLYALNADQLEAWRDTRARHALIPRFGSLSGIDASGETRTPAFAGSGYLLMFPIRADRLPADIAYWNDVVRRVGSGSAPIDYWGICDAGAACREYQSTASFRIIGFLDAYEMRVVASSYARGDILLYNKLQILELSLQRAPEAPAMADAIRKAAK